MINSRVEEIKELFAKHNNWEDKYREIIKIGKSLNELDSDKQIEKFKIKGCQSQVWLYPKYNGGIVTFGAWSDAVLVKGIIGILVNVYSGLKPDQILEIKPTFLSDIGITDHLSMNRTNGLASMMKQIQMYAVVYKSMQDKGLQSAPDL